MMDSFYKKHPLWRLMPPDPRDAKEILSFKVRAADEKGLVWGFYLDGVMIAVALFYHL